MKKTLRNFAMVAAMALPFAASAEIYIDAIYCNGVTATEANPVPGLDADWAGPTATNPGTKTCSRFAVGKDGKFYTTDVSTNSIIYYDGQKTVHVATLSEVTQTGWSNAWFTAPENPDARWNGTAVSMDDAGNIIFNYCFATTASLQHWGVITPDGTVTDVDLSTTLAELGAKKRLDNISHIVGDVTSPEGGYGYAATGDESIFCFHFTGDGKKVTGLTAKASVSAPALANAWTPVPAYDFETLKDEEYPENCFYAAVSTTEIATAIDNTVAVYDGFGNRKYLDLGMIYINGEQLFVRQYLDPNSPYASTLTAPAVMTLGVFNQYGDCVATWTGSLYNQTAGMGSLTVETVDENTANVYLWYATVANNGATPAGCYAAMLRVSTKPLSDKGKGTEEDPYLVANAEDLCNMWQKMVEGQVTYFKQTADIDMTGVKYYIAPIDNNGSNTNHGIYYDGQNHIIKNFAPDNRKGENEGGYEAGRAYYCTSLFGLLQGTVKNLGIVNCNVVTDFWEAGVLGGFGGLALVSSYVPTAVVDNVYITGSVEQTMAGRLCGGMFGMTTLPVAISNSYLQIDLKGLGNTAGFMAKVDGADVTISNCYVAGKIEGAEGKTGLVVAKDAADAAKLTVTDVYAFGEGEAANFPLTGATVVPAEDADAIAAIQSWAAFNKGYLYNGLPALNWQKDFSGIYDIVDDASNAPAVYYNLQGVEVANPENGIYIVRRGNKVTKELVR